MDWSRVVRIVEPAFLALALVLGLLAIVFG